MKIFLVADTGRWGYSYTVVRAKNYDDAAHFAGVPKAKPVGAINDYEPLRQWVYELPADGPEQILWCQDESPDTGE